MKKLVGNILNKNSLSFVDKNKILFVAEIANSHEGNKDKMLSLIKLGCNINADIVKIQIYCAEELLKKNHPRFDHFKNLEFDEKFWKKITFVNS